MATIDPGEMSYDQAEQAAENYGGPSFTVRMATVTNETRLAWLVDGELRSGRLAEYAHDHDHGDLVGVDVSAEIWVAYNGDLRKTAPAIRFTGYNDDDYGSVIITLGDAEASYLRDGRA